MKNPTTKQIKMVLEFLKPELEKVLTERLAGVLTNNTMSEIIAQKMHLQKLDEQTPATLDGR